MHARPVPPYRLLAALGLGVLAAHALLVAAWLRPAPAGGRPAAGRLVQLKVLPAPAPGPVPVAAGPGAAAMDATPPRGGVPAAPDRQAGRPAPPRRLPSAAHPAPADAVTPTPPARPGPAADERPVSALAEAALPRAEGAPLPVYPTALPPSVQLHYRLRRGEAFSAATLSWQPGPDQYQLEWQGAAPNGQAIGRVSRGTIQSHGIEPERYAESRRGREQRAVNFQRDAGLISFSGPQKRVALAPGAQDRVSWMLQLAGVMAADPRLGVPGTGVSMLVASPRGEADVWRFVVIGPEDLPPSEGGAETPTATLHLRREARRPYDTEVDIWLDPARHHLPLRVRLRTVPDGAGSEMELLSVTANP